MSTAMTYMYVLCPLPAFVPTLTTSPLCQISNRHTLQQQKFPLHMGSRATSRVPYGRTHMMKGPGVLQSYVHSLLVSVVRVAKRDMARLNIPYQSQCRPCLMIGNYRA